MAAVPLALLSAAWTTHLAGEAPPTPTPTAARVDQPVAAPAAVLAVEVPQAPVEVPASLSVTNEVTAATVGPVTPVASTPSTGEIPAAALSAYQRAETVINTADTSCRLSWQLVAAVGRVESDHGRFGGATIGADGVVTPAILGPVLDGGSGTARISDTDAGQYDGDTAFDRAVGPMQFIPSTWSVVGVDADNDGVRNPQDIDDAALAAAVYLCSGTEDLASDAGRRAAVYRYNHSDSYVDQVLSIMTSYLDGDFASLPPTSVSAGAVVPVAPLQPVDYGTTGDATDVAAALHVGAIRLDIPVDHAQALAPFGPPVPVEEPTDGGGTDPVAPGEPTDPTDPTDPTTPSDPPTGDPLPTDPPAEPSDPASDPVAADPATPTEPAAPTTDPTADPVVTGPSDEAVEYCAEAGYVDDPESTEDDYDTCVADYDAAVAAGEDPTAPADPSVTEIGPVPSASTTRDEPGLD